MSTRLIAYGVFVSMDQTDTSLKPDEAVKRMLVAINSAIAKLPGDPVVDVHEEDLDVTLDEDDEGDEEEA